MATRVEVRFQGLTATTWTQKEGQVHVMLPNGWNPRVATDQTALPPHYAFVAYDLASRDEHNSDRPDLIIPEPNGTINRAFHLLKGSVIKLAGQEGSSLVPADDATGNPKKTVASISETCPGSGTLKPEVLNCTAPELVAGCTTLGAGKIKSHQEVGRKWRYKGQDVALATMLILEYEIEDSELTIILEKMNDKTVWKTIVLEPIDGVISVTIGNDPLSDLLGLVDQHRSHRHYEIYYDLSENLPAQKPYPVLQPAGHQHPPSGAALGSGFCGPPSDFP